MSKILFTNAHIIDPILGLDTNKDILIVDGVIENIADNISVQSSDAVQTVDLQGKICSPGFYDMHVHFRDPGQEHKEDLFSGARSAANGGFTGVACMPNTNPDIDSADTVRYILDKAKGLPVDIHPVAAVTRGRKGEELAPMAEMHKAGAVAFSDDGAPVSNPKIMRIALEYASMFQTPIIQHAEDLDLSDNGVVNEGYMSTLKGLPPSTSLAEDVMVARDVALVEYLDCQYHVAHISSIGAMNAVRTAKEKGLKVTSEVTPHHFSISEEAISEYDTNAKMSPPLRTMDDIIAAKEGLRDGVIDCIATDHAPHARFEKEVEFVYAPFGIVGLETALGLSMTELVLQQYLTIPELIEKMSSNPRRILRLPDIRIEIGQKANLTFFDPEAQWTVDCSLFKSKSNNSPFNGYNLTGKALGIYNNGQLVWNQ
jgi:dihydroorotase